MNEFYEVRAVRWARGWELHIDGVGVTQSRSLASAERQVRDYLATLYDVDADGVDVVVRPEVDGLEERAAQAVARTRAAEEESRSAAAQVRAVVTQLRDAGVSVDDTARIMGVSKGRVSQLTRTA
ncbi:MAG: antitoxin HicB [Micrococcales bacterium]|nr:antitoxin HicB [Micrococcales bacterium]